MATLADGLLAGIQGAQAMAQQRFQRKMAEEQLALNKEQLELSKQRTDQLERQQQIADDAAFRLQRSADNADFISSTPSSIKYDTSTGDIKAEEITRINSSGTQEERDWLAGVVGYDTKWLKNADGESLEVKGVVPLPPSAGNPQGGYAIQIRNTVTGKDGVITQNGTKDPTEAVQVFSPEQLAGRASRSLSRILNDGGFQSSILANRASADMYDMQAAAYTDVANNIIGNSDALSPVEQRNLAIGLDEMDVTQLRQVILEAGGQEALDAADAEIARRESELQKNTPKVPKGYSAVDVTSIPSSNTAVQNLGNSWNKTIGGLAEAQQNLQNAEQSLAELESSGANRFKLSSARSRVEGLKDIVSNQQQQVDNALADLGARIEAAEAKAQEVDKRGQGSNNRRNFPRNPDVRNLDQLKALYAQMDPSAVLANTKLDSGATSPAINITKEVLFGEATRLNKAIEEANLSPDFINAQRNYLQQQGIQSAQDLVDKLPPREYMIAAFTIASATKDPKQREELIQGFRNQYNRGANDYTFGQQIDDQINIAQLAQNDRDFMLDLQKFQYERMNSADEAVKFAAEYVDPLIQDMFNTKDDITLEDLKGRWQSYQSIVNNAAADATSDQRKALASYEPMLIGGILQKYIAENNYETLGEWFKNIMRESQDAELNMSDIYRSMVLSEDGTTIAFLADPGIDWRGKDVFEGEIDDVELDRLFGYEKGQQIRTELKRRNRVANF